jgi:hypothetical protein
MKYMMTIHNDSKERKWDKAGFTEYPNLVGFVEYRSLLDSWNNFPLDASM